MRILTAALGAAFIFASAAEAQQRAIQRGTDSPAAQNTQLGSAPLPNQGRITCHPDGVTMTIEGLAIQCRYYNPSTQRQELYRVAFDGGTRPGGIAATMALINHHRLEASSGEALSIRVREPGDRAQNICAMAWGGSDTLYPCVEAVSIHDPS